MDFMKVLHACQPCTEFREERLTNAQVESIVVAGQSAPVVEELQESFHISAIRSEYAQEYLEIPITDLPEKTRDEIKTGGPVYFIISVKDNQQSPESMFLYAGMIMAHMQMQATSILLGYNFLSEQKTVKLLEAPEQKRRLGIPQDFTPIQILKVGYTEEPVENRTPILSEVFTRIIS
ncbi:nitroreductase family protein [Jeotgalibaca caeni]|uniref:nitroreductase family protein n=1 Tax=Jeotgalibaca caeni TaxID=3028623 RepID=UPI00237D89AA|nr:nitroreductase family protein [Jeotgalibaca caeni]MDE1547702.1 nitroreductase family protein [Jeotgalibaca caeni]